MGGLPKPGIANPVLAPAPFLMQAFEVFRVFQAPILLVLNLPCLLTLRQGTDRLIGPVFAGGEFILADWTAHKENITYKSGSVKERRGNS